ncbi:hypothetical protein [Paenibacillus sp. GYB003]|uniref:hypothetical protein n=1 Tax=Paenibacillus sp. GYB003 TaxID=2994392 RepID=UPI002F96E432
MAESILFATDRYKRNLEESASREFDYTKALKSGNWSEWQRAFRQRLAEMTGLTHIRERNRNLPLSPRIALVEHFPGYRRE